MSQAQNLYQDAVTKEINEAALPVVSKAKELDIGEQRPSVQCPGAGGYQTEISALVT